MRLSYLILLPLATACDGLAPAPQLSVEMDAAVYIRDTSGIAAASFIVRNVSGASLYFRGCQTPIPARIERRSDDAWIDYLQHNTICQANIVPTALVLGAGETYRDTFRWDAPAVYRIRVLYGRRSDQPYALEALGAPFEVR